MAENRPDVGDVHHDRARSRALGFALGNELTKLGRREVGQPRLTEAAL